MNRDTQSRKTNVWTAIPNAFGEEKSGELWSTNNNDGRVTLGPPTQINFFRRPWASNYYMRYRMTQAC